MTDAEKIAVLREALEELKASISDWDVFNQKGRQEFTGQRLGRAKQGADYALAATEPSSKSLAYKEALKAVGNIAPQDSEPEGELRTDK